ncbi:MAG: STAS domain-containing protein [Solirubrobacterales bacterium]|nr:STAS domain-containing protein [Solirubrobacterales bacterium]
MRARHRIDDKEAQVGEAEETDATPAQGFSVSVAEAAGGGAVVAVVGELDLATAPRLRDAFGEALQMSGDVVADLRGCGFVDSSGIAALVGAAWRLKEQDRTLRIRGARGPVRQVLELTGLPGHAAIVLEPAPQ